MGLGCIDPPPVKEDPKELICNLKLKLKLTKVKAEKKINEKNREIEKCKELAEFNLKNGNKTEAKKQIEEKQLKQKIIEILHLKIDIIDDQIMLLESVEVNQDITGIIDSIDKKISKVNLDIENGELEENARQMLKEENNKRRIDEELVGEIKQSNEEDLNLLEELKQLEAEVNEWSKGKIENLVNEYDYFFQRAIM